MQSLISMALALDICQS